MASRKQQQKKAWLLSYTAELKPINGSDDQCHLSGVSVSSFPANRTSKGLLLFSLPCASELGDSESAVLPPSTRAINNLLKSRLPLTSVAAWPTQTPFSKREN